MDLFPTLARVTGSKVPTDRAIDGIDQLDFFMGKQEKSNRDGFVIYVGNDIFGVKWHNWKMMNKKLDVGTSAPRSGAFRRSSTSISIQPKNTP